MHTDPISDYLTRLRNATKAGLRVVDIPASNIKLQITQVLFEYGYIYSYRCEESDGKKTNKNCFKI
ncbi:MAG: 30S ribosomal protein S8 [Solitalea-like symbiont of Acarus siro]